jgi:hypothetical protein
MLKKRNERYIIEKSIINMVLFIAISMVSPVFGSDFNDEFEIKPAYIFENKAGRDPFEPRTKKESFPAMVEVDITTFSLQGITESRGMKAALFKNRSGSTFGYIFIDGKLYGENDTVIPYVNGEIKESGEVILIQGDREVIFRLNEDPQGPNIRPDTKFNGANN